MGDPHCGVLEESGHALGLCFPICKVGLLRTPLSGACAVITGDAMGQMHGRHTARLPPKSFSQVTQAIPTRTHTRVPEKKAAAEKLRPSPRASLELVSGDGVVWGLRCWVVVSTHRQGQLVRSWNVTVPGRAPPGSGPGEAHFLSHWLLCAVSAGRL